MPVSEQILRLEREIRRYQADSTAGPQRVRAALRDALSHLTGRSNDGMSIADLIAPENLVEGNRRVIAHIILRCASVRGLLPENTPENHINRKIVELLKIGAADICDRFSVNLNCPPHIGRQLAEELFPRILEILRPLRIESDNISVIVGKRQDIQRCLAQKVIKSALQEFDIDRMIGIIPAILALLEELPNISDYTLSYKISDLRELISREQEYCASTDTELQSAYYTPFLKSVARAVTALEKESMFRFECEVKLRPGQGGELEKRYPLNESGRVFNISVPLVNTGPGLAKDVTILVLPESEHVVENSQLVRLGDIPPGNFAFSLETMVVERLDSVTLNIELEWGQIASVERKHTQASLLVRAQPADQDWTSLEHKHPYSTDVAIGDEFVGRAEKIAQIVGSLVKERMESCYITGQKRVGKSSLALAVRDEVKERRRDDRFSFIYLEWGEYSHSNPALTLRNLGDRIASEMLRFAPREARIPNLDFTGSLSQLSHLADLLKTWAPEHRIVIILDEFDELHPELYRIGPLAETFFSNIRALSAKTNVSFILIGGEKMPFIISSQGDQLNKFVRHKLDYFMRDKEWDDFQELVARPVKGVVRWHLSALNALFNCVNGHPYYTKLLCSFIYNRAIRERDLDVTEIEVERAYNQAISQLDTNAFAHLWKDGISGSREEEESIALKRCRFLVAAGRALRHGDPLTVSNLLKHKQSTRLADADVEALLHEFSRREVISEDAGAYRFSIPLFSDWLTQVGVNLLIADTLGDEFAAATEKAERAAYVTSEELCDVADKWPPYQGRKITGEDLRKWISQRPSHRHQRVLFTLLQHVRFFSEIEIREKLRTIHASAVTPELPEFAKRKRADVRRDILVTYLDGAAKSGAAYAALYAEVNSIGNKNVVEITAFSDALSAPENADVKAIVIVDDLVGTGDTLSAGLTDFLNVHGAEIAKRGLKFFVIVLTATSDGLERVRSTINSMEFANISLRVCEPLGKNHFAFAEVPGIWGEESKYYEARALCRELGSQVSKKAPLGYKDQGLLVVFPTTCPNNTLPILHAGSTGARPWKPLFRRPVH